MLKLCCCVNVHWSEHAESKKKNKEIAVEWIKFYKINNDLKWNTFEAYK